MSNIKEALQRYRELLDKRRAINKELEQLAQSITELENEESKEAKINHTER